MAFSAIFDLSTLDGSNGFIINGIDVGDYFGYSVSSAGDINGDGIDDLIIGAYGADPNGDSRAGESYVVFGSSSGFSASFDLSTLDGSNGFVINGIDPSDFSGTSVSSAGDVNGDGIDDLIIGAYGADPNGDSRAGESYVVFGSSSGFSASFDLSTLDGSNGFVINGIDVDDFSGNSVSSAGDVNGDGIDDLIIGANGADPNGDSFAGESYVVFGNSSGFSASFDLSTLDGSNGFVINGIDPSDISGRSVSNAGDVNGDGIDDIIIGANRADPNGIGSAGESYVIFGSSSGFSANFDLSTLNGSNGFVINGIDTGAQSGLSVSSAGDVNGDGIDDLIIGAPRALFNGAIPPLGQSYVVFGSSSGFSASFDLSTLDGSNGFAINGVDPLDYLGWSVSGAGDVNGDGIDDLIIGAYGVDDPNGNDYAGKGYVVFGSSSGFSASLDLSTLNGTNGFIIDGSIGGDQLGWSVSGAGDVNGDGIDDLIIGAYGVNNYTGASYVIFGQASNQAPTAVNDSVITDEDTAVSGNVLANDNDPDLDPLTVTEVNGVATNVGTPITLASGALLTLNADGSYNYDPNGQYESLAVGSTATDSFTYTISDGNGSTDTATVNVTINGVNDAPTVVSPIIATATEDDVPFTVNLLDGVTDPDNGAVLSFINTTPTILASFNFDGGNRASTDTDSLTFASLFTSPVSGSFAGEFGVLLNEDIDGVPGGETSDALGWSARAERDATNSYFQQDLRSDAICSVMSKTRSLLISNLYILII